MRKPGMFNRKLSDDLVLRIASAAGLILSCAAGATIGGKSVVWSLFYSMAVSASVLLIPKSFVPRKRILAGFGAQAAALSVSVLSFIIPERWTELAFVTVIVSSVIAVRVVEILGNLSDYLFLSSRLSGWDHIQVRSHDLFSMAILAVTSVHISSSDNAFLHSVSLLAMTLVYILILIRTYYTPYSEETKHNRHLMRKIAREVNICPETEMKSVDMKYRVLYYRMTEYMENEKPYLSDSFSMEDMARAIGTNRNYVSKMINDCTRRNFSRFVNEYRIRYAMELYRSNRSLKTVDMAHLSGFRSAVTFNMAFKVFMNSTPGEWCREDDKECRVSRVPSSPQESVP